MVVSGASIPSKANLVFKVELVEIVEGEMKWVKIDGPSCLRKEGVFNGDLLTIQYSGVSATGYRHDTGYVPLPAHSQWGKVGN